MAPRSPKCSNCRWRSRWPPTATASAAAASAASRSTPGNCRSGNTTSGARPPASWHICASASARTLRRGRHLSEAGDELDALLALMRTLRDPQAGCPWDREQDFVSIAPFTIEEAYEIADAIGRGDLDRLRDELGDLLFQVVFHARMAEEAGRFDFAAVARGIRDKLIRRHPHLFAEPRSVDVAQLHLSWETQKASERAAAGVHGGAAGCTASTAGAGARRQARPPRPPRGLRLARGRRRARQDR